MNVWNFTGNLGGDAEQRFTPSGESVVSFSVGVKAGYGDKATTTWARCQMWGKRGESVMPYLMKGQLVGVSGELSSREWEDKQGQKRTSIEVRANDLTLLGKKEASSAPQTNREQHKTANAHAANGGGFADMDDDVPFLQIGRGMAAYVI